MFFEIARTFSCVRAEVAVYCSYLFLCHINVIMMGHRVFLLWLLWHLNLQDLNFCLTLDGSVKHCDYQDDIDETVLRREEQSE